MTEDAISIGGVDLADPNTYVAGMPYEAFHRLRQHARVAWHPYKDGPGFLALTGYDEVLAVFTYQRNHTSINAEAHLDGIYVLRTSVPTADLDAAGVVTGYKNLANVERDFRSIKTDDVDLRPIHHRLTERVQAHVLICLLACYVTWHLRQAWAPLTFTDDAPPSRNNPVAAAKRSPATQAKASRQQAPDGTPLRSFRALLDHLATLTRNQIRYHGANVEIDKLSDPTTDQRRAFELIGAAIPLTIAA
ncbi:MAG: hypothetical protein ACLQLO_30375 [Mycobacterium sp.]